MAVRRVLQFSCLLLALCVSAQAQFIGYTSQQTTQSTPFNAVTCTAALAAGAVSVTNIGQGAHQVTMQALTGGPTTLTYTIQGSYDGVHFADISDVGTYTNQTAGITGIDATGYYPVVAVKVGSCLPASATVTLFYSGISMTPGQPRGTNLAGQVVKTIGSQAAANTSLTSAVLRSPFGSAAGTLQFNYVGTGPSGSTLQVSCGTSPGFLVAATGTFALQTTAGVPQDFPIPASTCPYFTVTYASGGASASTFYLDYAFANFGLPPTAFQYSHITGTTATAVKGTQGLVHTVTINTGAAGTVSLFDLPAASCTGTPATSTVAVITATATTLQTFTYDANFLQGICVKASAAMDFSVSYQ